MPESMPEPIPSYALARDKLHLERFSRYQEDLLSLSAKLAREHSVGFEHARSKFVFSPKATGSKRATLPVV